MMQVSSRTEYGLRLLLLLAHREKGKAFPMSEIIRQEHLPRHYAEQILMRLRRAGLVKSVRGIQGGFALAGPASTISLGAVLNALEDAPLRDTCDHFNRRTDCGHLGDCSIRPVWNIIAKRLWDALDNITLQHLIGGESDVSRTLAIELPILNLPEITGRTTPNA